MAPSKTAFSILVALVVLNVGAVAANYLDAAPHVFCVADPAASAWSEDTQCQIVPSLSQPELFGVSRFGRNHDSCGFRLEYLFHRMDARNKDGRVHSNIVGSSFHFPSVSRQTLLCHWLI
jgi:hypothetical protein